MSTSSQKSSSSASRPRAQGRIATPKGSRKKPKDRLTATPRSVGSGGRGASGGLGGLGSLGGHKATKRGKLEVPKATKRTESLGASSRAAAAPSTRRPASHGTGKTASGRPLMASRETLRSAGAAAPNRSSAAVTSAGRGLGSAAGGIDKLRIAFGAAVGVGVLAIVAIIVLLVLSQLPVFVIESIDATASEHVSAEAIAKLAAVDEGTTLLSVDIGRVQESVSQNPWVKKVNVTREFPDKLGISVEERGVWAVAVIGSGSSVWALGEDGVWIEPLKLDTGDSGDVSSAALAKAKELGCLLVGDLPASVNPAQGSLATDDVIQAVMTYQQEFSDDLSQQVQAYYAQSEGSISMLLKSGLEVSLGAPSDVASKQAALLEVMNKYPNQLTYVNVRVPTNPSYRKVSGDSLTVPSGDSSSGGDSSASSDSAASDDGSNVSSTDDTSTNAATDSESSTE